MWLGLTPFLGRGSTLRGNLRTHGVSLMATDSATATLPAAAEPDPTTYFWQVPIFLIGAAVFVAAWQGWLSLGTPDPGDEFARDLAALRIAAERVTPDRDELNDLLAKIAVQVDNFPEQAAFAQFILGSGYARLAELNPSPEEARRQWNLARQHFELLHDQQLSDPEDRPKLSFRSIKATVGVGLPANTSPADLRRYITLLGSPPAGDETGEAGRLRADLALRLSPPDTLTACAALEDYLRKTGVATPAASLSRAKLMLGDIYMRKKEYDPARKWLEQISADAPPDVLAPGKMLLAQVKMKESQDWLDAARDLEALRIQPGVSQSLRAASAYYLGVCKANTREPEVAIKLFEEAVKGDSQEATAAAVRLAEMYLKGTDAARRAAVPDLLASAVKGVTDPKHFRNTLIAVETVQETFDLAVSVLVADGAYEQAVKVADTYAAVAAAGRDREKKAEVLAAWAELLQKSKGEFKSKAAVAAAEYEGLAALQPAVTAKADVLRRAASMYRLAGDPSKAVAVLQTVVGMQLPDSASGPAWSDLADSLIAAKRPDEVWRALNEIMKLASPMSTAVRYRLARQFTDTRQPEHAALGRALFEQIAKQENVSPEEHESHERALVDLAHELIRANNFTDAEAWLRKQLNMYPTGPESSLGRLLLGVCLLQRASTPVPGVDPKSPAVAAAALKMRNEALALFQQVVIDTDKKLGREGKLGERDSWLRLQAGLRVLQTYQQLKQPKELLIEAAILLDHHRGTIEELIIRSLIYHAFKQQGKTVEALQTRDQMKELFDRLPATAFIAQDGEYSRKYWMEVWFADK
jgi:tetratricopeptide (TPR) repeat protein